MASVWYIGPSHLRVIKSSDWASLGIEAQESRWDRVNGFSLPESQFNQQQLDILDKDAGFLVGAPDGPRPDTEVVSDPNEKVLLSEFKETTARLIQRIQAVESNPGGGGGGGNIHTEVRTVVSEFDPETFTGFSCIETIEHNLGTEAVFPVIRDSYGRNIFPSWRTHGANHIVITFPAFIADRDEPQKMPDTDYNITVMGFPGGIPALPVNAVMDPGDGSFPPGTPEGEQAAYIETMYGVINMMTPGVPTGRFAMVNYSMMEGEVDATVSSAMSGVGYEVSQQISTYMENMQILQKLDGFRNDLAALKFGYTLMEVVPMDQEIKAGPQFASRFGWLPTRRFEFSWIYVQLDTRTAPGQKVIVELTYPFKQETGPALNWETPSGPVPMRVEIGPDAGNGSVNVSYDYRWLVEGSVNSGLGVRVTLEGEGPFPKGMIIQFS